jgi:alcohol dehydrogenase
VPMVRAIAWELDILGSHGMAASAYPEMLRLIATGALRPLDLIERVVGLEEACRLLPAMDAASAAGMTMIDPGGRQLPRRRLPITRAAAVCE